jgi:hypothetical protein
MNFKTKRICLLCLFFLISTQTGFAKTGDQNEFRLINDTKVNFNDVSGPGRSASSLTDGTTYIESLNLYSRGNKDDFKYIFNLGGRTTNDKRYDTAEFALTSLKGHFTYQDHQVTAGDVFESYSQFSLDSALKGTSYKYYNETDNLPNVSFVYGVAYPRWENLWDGYDLVALKRQVYGANITHDFNPVFTAGFSVVHSDDSKPVNINDTLFNTTIYAIDAKYKPIPGLTINAESAFSDTSENNSSGTPSDDYTGTAQKLEIIGDGHPSRVVLKYERISPKFKTLTGSAISNQERVNSSWRYKYTKNITTDLKFLWLKNYIDSSPQSTQNWQPFASITIRKLFGRRYARSSLSYKFEKKTGNDLTTLNQYLTLTHSDRYGILENSTSLGINSFDTNNATRDQMDYTANTTFNSRHKRGDFVIKPMLSAGTFFYENQLINETNQVLQYSVGVGLDIPKKKIYSKFTFGQNKLHSYGQDNSDKWFVRANIYYKPQFSKYLTRSTFSLTGAINDYSFSTATRNFVEKSLSLGINFPLSIK